MYLNPLSAGYPAEAYNYIEKTIDFNEYLIHTPETTFCLWADGDSMNGDGIFKGDLLVVDKLLNPKEGDILIFSIKGEFTMKRLQVYDDHIELVSSNPKYKPIRVQEGEQLQRWGVVTAVIKKFRK